MSKREFLLVFLVVFMAGCITSGVVKELVIPKLNAGQENVQKWKYFCGLVQGGDDHVMNANNFTNKAGAEGWELVTVDKSTRGRVYCFKRPLN